MPDNTGDCFAAEEQLVHTASELLDVDQNLIVMTLDEMKKSKDVITENISTDKVSYSTENKDGQKKVIAVYLPPFYFSEVGVAKRIQAILKAPTGKSKADTDTVPKNDRADGIHYDRITDVGNALEPRGE